MKNKKFIAGILAIILLTVLMLCGCSGCESCSRSLKSFSSDFGGGLNRVLTVYNANGEVVERYEGKFDIEENDSGTKILFDLDGKRTIIYLGSGFVICQEK